MDITLDFPAPPIGEICGPSKDVFLGSIDCVRLGSCNNMQFRMNNNGCDRIIIEGIECGVGSCEGLLFLDLYKYTTFLSHKYLTI